MCLESFSLKIIVTAHMSYRNNSILIALLIFAGAFPMTAQVSGNQVFANGNDGQYSRIESTGKRDGLTKLYLNDSSFLIQAKVLVNVKADYYVAVFGISDEGATVAEGTGKIAKRVRSFINSIKQSGIKDDDIYTDIIAQYRIYDYKQNEQEKAVEEYLKGVELSRNVIVKYTNAAQIEELLNLASKEQILDLVKVDYVVEDVSKVYDELWDVATNVINKKKGRYTKLTDAKLKPGSQVYAENFASYYPIEMYKHYKAFSTSYYDSYWNYNDRKKSLRKFVTFYYDKLDYSGFDKVVRPTIVEPAIQFVMTLQVRYEIVR